MQISEGREVWFNGLKSNSPSVDLVIADLPEGLPVPGISNPVDSIPSWNSRHVALNTMNDPFVSSIFSFCHKYLHDDGALIILQPLDSRRVFEGYLKNANLKVAFHWICFNKLMLQHPLYKDHKVCSSLNQYLLIQIVNFFCLIFSHSLLSHVYSSSNIHILLMVDSPLCSCTPYSGFKLHFSTETTSI